MIGSKSRDRSTFVVVLLIVLAAILIGCGGGGGGGNGSPGSSATAGTSATASSTGGATTSTTSGSNTSQVVFNLEWPAFTRGIPSYAKSVVLTLTRTGSTNPIVRTINRQSNLAYMQAITFGDLVPGTYTVLGQAYLDSNAQGPLVATFSATINAAAGQEVNPPLSFSSTIGSVVIDGAPFVMLTGVTTQLTGHAVDADDNIMLLPPGTLTWTVVQGADLVSMTPVGFLSALAPGTVTVRLEDNESHQFAEVTFEITGEALTTGGDGSTTGTTDTTGGTTDTGGTTATGGDTTTTTTGSDTTTGGGTATTGGDTTTGGGDTTGGGTTGGGTTGGGASGGGSGD